MTPLFTEDRVETPKAPKAPPVVAAKPRPTPLATVVNKVTDFFKPPVEAPKEQPAPVAARPKPAPVRAAPPMPALPVITTQPKDEPAPVSRPRPTVPVTEPIARRPAPV